MNIISDNRQLFSSMPLPLHKATRRNYVSVTGPAKISCDEVFRPKFSESYDQRSICETSSQYTSAYRETMYAKRKKEHIQSVLDMMGRRHKRRRSHRSQNNYDSLKFQFNKTSEISKMDSSQAYQKRGRRLAIPDNKLRTTYKDMLGQVDQMTNPSDPENNDDFMNRQRKFFSRVKFIILLLRMAKTYIFSESDRKLLNLYTAMDAAKKADSYKIQNDLVFDVTRFKASKKRRVSKETKRVLSLDSEDRTDMDIYHVQVELQRLKPLGRYPIDMQKRLIQKAWFESYGQHRVLIRFGRRPWTFYVILSGSAVILEGDPADIGREVVPIDPGDTFGERAITDRRHHRITVISKEPIELMCLSAKDYVDIFLAAGMTNCCNNEYRRSRESGHSRESNCEVVIRKRISVNLTNQLNSFLKSIRIFDSWPVDLLQSYPDKCTFDFYKPKAIIVEDSRTSEWIYLIRSGSCAVMKILQHNVGHEEKQPKFPVKRRLNRQNHSFGYHENDIKQRSKAFFKNRAELLKGKWIRPAERPTNMIKVSVRDETQVKYESRDAIEEESRITTHRFESGERGQMPEKQMKVEQDFIDFKKGPFYTYTTTKIGNRDVLTTDEENSEETKGKHKPTIISEPKPVDLGVSRTRKKSTSYVKIDTLEKGNVFGVLELAFGEQPKLSLVSNGAECVLISKKFFIQHCSEETIKDITDNMRPYPNDDTSRRDVQEKLNWRKKRDLTMQEVVDNFKRNIRLRTQIRP